MARWARSPMVSGKPSRVARCFAFKAAWSRPFFIVNSCSISSWQSVEIRPLVARNQFAQALGRQHVHLVAPLIEVLCHFQPACCLEPDDQAAIVLRLDNLGWVEKEFGGALRGLRCEPPHDFAKLFWILINTKRLSSVGI